jgi:hypothetical protein
MTIIFNFTMKKSIASCFLSLLLFITGSLKSQNIIAPATKIESLLCKKWVIDYAIANNTKMDAPADRKDIYFDFKKNKTFCCFD